MGLIRNMMNFFRRDADVVDVVDTPQPAPRDRADIEADVIIVALTQTTGHDYAQGRDTITKMLRERGDDSHVTCSFNISGLGLPYIDVIRADEYERHKPGYAMLEDIYEEGAIRAGDNYVWSNGPRLRTRDVTSDAP